jgi:uncharacterized protein (DUF885 family)
MDRREFLSLGSVAALLPAAPAKAALQSGGSASDAQLNGLFEDIFQDRVKRYPDLASSLGLDKGANAHLKAELDVRPIAQARKEDLALAKKNIADIKAVPPGSLSDAGKLNREVVLYQMETGAIPAREIQHR